MQTLNFRFDISGYHLHPLSTEMCVENAHVIGYTDTEVDCVKL